MARTIESPGVEINEIDLSNITQLPVGTNIFVQGFAAQGPTQELLNVTSISEFERIYGLPTNAAERYAYTSVKQVLQSPGNLIFNRLPYGSDEGTGTGREYTALAYPYTVIPSASSSFSGVTGTPTWDVALSDEDSYQGIIVGSPTLVSMNLSSYEALKSGDLTTAGASTTWSTSASTTTIDSISSINKSAFIITNDNKTSIEKDYSGYYLSVTDNTNIGDDTYNKIVNISSRNAGGDYDLPDESLTFELSSEGDVFSTSEVVETALGFNFQQSDFNDMVQISLMRLRPDYLNQVGTGTSLAQTLVSVVPGSLDALKLGTNLSGGVKPSTEFLDNTVSTYGQGNISVLTNPVLATNFAGKKVRMVDSNITTSAELSSKYEFDVSVFSPDQLTVLTSAVTAMGNTNELVALGEYEPCTDSQYKIIGATASKLDRGFRLANNRDLVPLDIVVDAGLSTIETVSYLISQGDAGTHLNNQDIFDDTVTVNLSSLEQQNTTPTDGFNRWTVMYNKYNTFCKDTRKDCMFIIDPLRNIFVQGRDSKVLDNQTKNFSQHILTPLKNLASVANTNYGAMYGNWVKAYDDASDTLNWVPFSAFQAAIMARVDANLQPWIAPAGFNNGLVTGIVDLAISPNQKERDLLYRVSINPVTNFPGDGFVVFGQKTLQAKPSSLDRINVRRLFLVLEKATRQVAKYFVFEPNTIFTRTRLVNVLTPIFENAKNNEGVYDYLIVCDERNNTPDVIDRNELVVDIYIKPVRAAEFILINFIATRTGDDFSELIGA
jgi:hypothetical protein